MSDDLDLTEAIDAAARAFHLDGWTCLAHEPLGLDECEDCAESTPRSARVALEAALPAIREQLAAQVEALAPDLAEWCSDYRQGRAHMAVEAAHTVRGCEQS